MKTIRKYCCKPHATNLNQKIQPNATVCRIFELGKKRSRMTSRNYLRAPNFMIGTASVQIACDAFVCENCVAEYENSDFILYFFLLAFVQACNAIERG